MVNDLWRGVQAEQNYLVALGLFTYSEALGRMILRTTGKRGRGWKAFREFTEQYVGYSFSNWQEVYDNFRNGLAHSYWIKDVGAVWDEDGSAPCGIDASGSVRAVRMRSYFMHFVEGLERALTAGVLK
jgi:hypothetical protein